MFKGSIVALVTPMLNNGDVDFSQLEALIDFHVREGTNALVIAGTTGESATLSHGEHCELLQRSYEIIGQPFIPNTIVKEIYILVYKIAPVTANMQHGVVHIGDDR